MRRYAGYACSSHHGTHVSYQLQSFKILAFKLTAMSQISVSIVAAQLEYGPNGQVLDDIHLGPRIEHQHHGIGRHQLHRHCFDKGKLVLERDTPRYQSISLVQ
jgi:hypothetical protein